MSYYVRLFAPLATGMGTAALVPSMENQGKQLYQTPPGWVFGLMWPALYIFVGVSWTQSAEEDPVFADILYSIITALLVLWIIVATGIQWRWSSPQKAIGIEYKRVSLYILVLILMASFVALGNSSNTISDVFIGIFTGWITFATMLNFEDVSKK